VAAIWKLPVVWLCENNGYAGSSPAAATLAVPDVADLGAGYGIPRAVADGTDVLAVIDVVEPALRRARSGEGPSLVELKTYRLRPFAESWGPDPRDPDEIESWKGRDPIARLRERLLERGVLTAERVERIDAEARREMGAARAFAEASPWPDPREAFEDLYA
jgi:pyruvate dehydrogenase E1 component alpha subunit